jgi:acyl carrier protein
MSLNGYNQSQDAVKTFIKEELFGRGEETFDETTDLIEAGVIDSLSLMRLISFVEENCHVQVSDEDMVAENFRTLAAIRSFIANRQPAPKMQND